MAITASRFKRDARAHVEARRKFIADQKQAKAAKLLAEVAAIYASNRTDENRLDLCNAIIDLIDDGDAYAERGTLMDELRCDEGGNPVKPDPADYGDWLYECRRDERMDREWAA